MRRLLPLLILPLVVLVGFFGCTKERLVTGGLNEDNSCMGCHSSEEALKAITGEGKDKTPAYAGREDG
jgi:hypothetical protein